MHFAKETAMHTEEDILLCERPAGLPTHPKIQPTSPTQDPETVDWVEVRRPLRIRRRKKYKCGHTGPRHFYVKIYGRKIVPGKKNFSLRCPQCLTRYLKNTAIRCCVCGKAILPGDGVILHDAEKVTWKGFEYWTIRNGEHAIGCITSCDVHEMHLAGLWNGRAVKSL